MSHEHDVQLLWQTRELAAPYIGNLSRDLRQQNISWFTGLYQMSIARQCEGEGRSQLIAELRQLPDELRRLFPNEPLTHASITSTIITLSKLLPIQEDALRTYAVDPYRAAMLTDAAWGIEQVTSAVIRGEWVRRGDVRNTINQALGDIAQVHTDTTEMLAASLQRQKVTERYESFGRLIAEDPTGFMLVDAMTAQLQGEQTSVAGEPFIHNFMIPSFVAAGAQMAREHYRQLYHLVVDTLPRLE